MKRLLTKPYARYLAFFAGGLLLGWLLFPTSSQQPDKNHENIPHEENATVWTCSMHPQIRMAHPGKCPICGMDLIPLHQNQTVDIDPGAISLTPEAMQLANIHTSVVRRQVPVKEVRLFGKVLPDERLIQNQVAHLPGRIEKLLINFTGQSVVKGQLLALIYSTDLITAQQELLETATMKTVQPEIYEAARNKLRSWKLSDTQIDAIEHTGKIQNEFPILSNTTGIVTSLRVKVGDHVGEGDVLFEVTDLSHIWIVFDAYESDLPFLRVGDIISFTVQALPGRHFERPIAFIDPVLDASTRVVTLRAEMQNPHLQLKPGMFVSGTVKARLGNKSYSLVIPRSAVLWTGKRSIVYVRLPNTQNPAFKMREIILGPSLGDSYIVESGLSEGEEIVTEGAFTVDAAAQLAGKPSMLSPVDTRIESSF